jgi:hypothetical protein
MNQVRFPGRVPDWLPTVLYGIVLFFLAAGRLEFGGFRDGVKVGGNIENLLPLLLVARYLSRKTPRQPLLEQFRLLAAPLLLIFSGLLMGWAANPSKEGGEDLLHFAGQALCGILLAEWLMEARALAGICGIVWLAGHLALNLRTPWGDPVNPNLEGPFSHRNVQAAFYLLSLPLLFFSMGTRWNLRNWRFALVLLVIGMEGFFVLLFRSRSGLLGFTIAAWLLVVAFLRSPQATPRRKKWVLASLLGLQTLGALALLPRFEGLAAEWGNPYQRSRAGIWAAAIESWKDPACWIAGIGMGDEFDRILLDTPTGNLNYHYRKAHYPHCLYLEWMYWGGITAFVGWCLVVFMAARLFLTTRLARDTSFRWEMAALSSAILGFAVSEIFESALRDPRVAACFWLDLALLLRLAAENLPPLSPQRGNAAPAGPHES